MLQLIIRIGTFFGGAEKLTFSFGGGFESQPIIFDDGSRGGITFNTFEFGPTLKLEIPGLFPTNVSLLSKRQNQKQFYLSLIISSKEMFLIEVCFN